MNRLVQGEAVDRRWARISLPRETWRFGSAAPADMAAFLQEPSAVRVASVDDIAAFLRGCAYVDDHDAFGEPDRWLAPAEFERRRAGDCEDHALWAWRKLHELGHPAEFVVGRWIAHPSQEDYHAWVVFTGPTGQRILLESVAKTWDAMLRPLSDAANDYLPFHSIDGALQTFTYAGYLIALDAGDPTAT